MALQDFSARLRRIAGPRNGLEASVMLMAALMVGFTLWAIREFLTPFALAVFLLLMIDGLARGLVKRAPWFPERLALPTAIVFIVALFGLHHMVGRGQRRPLRAAVGRLHPEAETC